VFLSVITFMDSYDLEVYQGATYSLSITLRDGNSNPIDLTDYNVSGFLKFRHSDSVRLASLNATKVAPYASGLVSLNIPSTGTERLPVGYGFYDVELYHTTSGTVSKVLIGKASIFPEVTY
jgi:hypothetical protein